MRSIAVSIPASAGQYFQRVGGYGWDGRQLSFNPLRYRAKTSLASLAG